MKNLRGDKERKAAPALAMLLSFVAGFAVSSTCQFQLSLMTVYPAADDTSRTLASTSSVLSSSSSSSSPEEDASDLHLVGDSSVLVEVPNSKQDKQQKQKQEEKVNDGVASVPLGFCRTSSSGYEILLESLVGMLFQEDGLMPLGDVLDVGAQFGEQACQFAVLAPERQVYAMDPSPTQVKGIMDKFASRLTNLNVIHAGIGQQIGTGVADKHFTGLKPGDTYPIETMDNVFFDQNRKLAFAHIDVEGREWEVLKGGNKTIHANRPIFTAEVRVHKDPEFTKNLLSHITDILQYDVYVVDEPCGWPHMDYRNLICFPRHLNPKLRHSNAFNLAAASGAILRVDAKSIFTKVYPQCALGQELCNTTSTTDKACCHEKTVQKWHEATCQKPPAMQGFTYSKRVVERFWKDLEQRTS
jgi:FkbM family methyltransferase